MEPSSVPFDDIPFKELLEGQQKPGVIARLKKGLSRMLTGTRFASEPEVAEVDEAHRVTGWPRMRQLIFDKLLEKKRVQASVLGHITGVFM